MVNPLNMVPQIPLPKIIPYDWDANPPFVTSGQVHSGAGPGPLFTMSQSYQQISTAISQMGTQIQADIQSLSWQGETAQAALVSFQQFNQGLQQLSQQAEVASQLAAAQAAATEANQSNMPPAAVSEAILALAITLLAMPWTHAAGMEMMGIFLAMWALTAALMSAFQGDSGVNTGGLPTLTQPADSGSSSDPLSELAQGLTSVLPEVAQMLALQQMQQKKPQTPLQPADDPSDDEPVVGSGYFGAGGSPDSGDSPALTAMNFGAPVALPGSWNGQNNLSEQLPAAQTTSAATSGGMPMGMMPPTGPSSGQRNRKEEDGDASVDYRYSSVPVDYMDPVPGVFSEDDEELSYDAMAESVDRWVGRA